jgi:hypothetical protein
MCCVLFERCVLFCAMYVFVCCVLLQYYCHCVKTNLQFKQIRILFSSTYNIY